MSDRPGFKPQVDYLLTTQFGGNLSNASQPQFLHLKKGCFEVTEWLQRMNSVITVKDLGLPPLRPLPCCAVGISFAPTCSLLLQFPGPRRPWQQEPPQPVRLCIHSPWCLPLMPERVVSGKMLVLESWPSLFLLCHLGQI